LRSRLYRSFSWPLAKRLRTEAEVAVVGGSRMLVRTDDSVGRVLAISGVWEPNVTAAFSRLLSPGDVCIDVGGHIGYYTLLASRLVGRDGHVYTFEPSPANYRSLSSNLARNGVANVTALQVAVGAGAGRAELYEGPGTNTGGATLSPLLGARRGGQPIVDVEVRPVADSVPEADWARIRVIKIDVEGYEVEVLRGLVPVLARTGSLAVFLELNPKWIPEIPQDVEAFCRDQEFTVQRLRTGYSLEGLFPGELSEPEDVDSIPAEHCDLLLTR
jgi:FkbM family methyltransferase